MKNKLSEPSDGQKTRNSTLPSPRMSKTCHRFLQKTEKTANSVDGIIKKRKKLRIPWTESSKNSENCEFRGRNRQKTAKTADSVGRIIKKRKKPAFPTLGKVKITRFLRFPTLGKDKITRFLRFPTLGKIKITQKLCFGAPRRAKNGENCVSATAER